jgi:hypothetical protein
MEGVPFWLWFLAFIGALTLGASIWMLGMFISWRLADAREVREEALAMALEDRADELREREELRARAERRARREARLKKPPDPLF